MKNQYYVTAKAPFHEATNVTVDVEVRKTALDTADAILLAVAEEMGTKPHNVTIISITKLN